jgi:aspartate--ammonia ligase
MQTIQTYISLLDRRTTEEAIEFVKGTFTRLLAEKLDLIKVSAPVAVLPNTGLNDDLNGVERPVSFPIKALDDTKAVVVHSLAKWKRLRLAELGIEEGKGLYTDMRALRPDEDFSPLHSIYVDQWDWEKHMSPRRRDLDFLKATVEAIYEAFRQTELEVCSRYPQITPVLPEKITFIHAEDLLQELPGMSVKARETEAAARYGAVFIMGIGGELSNGEPHDGRAPDYDDWSTATAKGYYGLNGDIVLWNPVLESAFEVSSMGIRVDKIALEKQLEIRGCTERKELMFHKMLLEGKLPQSIGGGIGQSRVCMFMLRKAHIGEVQVSIWPEELRKSCEASGIALL